MTQEQPECPSTVTNGGRDGPRHQPSARAATKMLIVVRLFWG